MNKEYYQEMLKRDRLIPILGINNKVKGFITYYICNGNLEKYLETDPWVVLNDEPDGNKCYVAQLITDKERNQKYSFRVFRNFVGYIKSKFPNVKEIHWRRYKDGQTRAYYKKI